MSEVAAKPLLSVTDLSVGFSADGAVRRVLHDLSFDLLSGETLAIVGESGSGKSVTALSLLGLLPRQQARILGGQALFRGTDLLALDEDRLRRVRGDQISMIFQEPMTSLNPVLRIGHQLTEGLIWHRGLSPACARARAIEMLEMVGIDAPERRLDQFPHQLSGGMRQRVMIAMALSTDPAILIADEPTTALDVTVQAHVLDLMRDLKARLGTSIILITHDMGVVAAMADRVIVMNGGQKVEEGTSEQIFRRPSQPYTRALLAAVPRLKVPERAATHSVPLLEVTGVSKTFHTGDHAVRALTNLSFTIATGEILGLVGESGSGKSTAGRAVLRLVDADHGAVWLDGQDLMRLPGPALRKARRQMQMIFQDPFASLDPRMRVGRQVAEPMRIHGVAGGSELNDRVAELFVAVGLEPDHAMRYPHEFSGGQRQRICIARAIGISPKLIVADEPTSALDVSVQARVLDLLQDLQARFGLTYLFISHDMAVIARMCQRIAVMYRGQVVELGPAASVLEAPRHPYTRALLAAVPVPDPAHRLRKPSEIDPRSMPRGALTEIAPGHLVAAA